MTIVDIFLDSKDFEMANIKDDGRELTDKRLDILYKKNLTLVDFYSN